MTENRLNATVSLRGVVFVDGDVLVVRRATDDGWELPGGRLGAREDVQEGVRREIAEETDLDVAVERPVHTVSWRNDADRGRFAVYFYCRCGERGVSLSPEHVAYEWERPASAADRLSTPQGHAVERAATTHRAAERKDAPSSTESE